MYWQIRHRSQLEISCATSRPTAATSIRIVVEGSVHDIDDHLPAQGSALAAISRKLSSRGSCRRRDCDMMTSELPTTRVLEVNTAGVDIEAPPSNVDVTIEESQVFSGDVTSTCRSEKTTDRDDITTATFPNTDAITAAPTGSRSIDNISDVSLTTPTSGRDDNGQVRVRFRFDTVSCAGVDQKDVISTCPLPKEPHPVRDQTVHRRSSPRDDTTCPDTARSEFRNSIRLSLPPTPARRLHQTPSEDVDEGRGEEAAWIRWLFRRRARGHQREKPSSALRKEIKAARQLGVIMGAFTVCFLSYLVSSIGPTRQPSSWSIHGPLQIEDHRQITYLRERNSIINGGRSIRTTKRTIVMIASRQ